MASGVDKSCNGVWIFYARGLSALFCNFDWKWCQHSALLFMAMILNSKCQKITALLHVNMVLPLYVRNWAVGWGTQWKCLHRSGYRVEGVVVVLGFTPLRYQEAAQCTCHCLATTHPTTTTTDISIDFSWFLPTNINDSVIDRIVVDTLPNMNIYIYAMNIMHIYGHGKDFKLSAL